MVKERVGVDTALSALDDDSGYIRLTVSANACSRVSSTLAHSSSLMIRAG